MADVKELNVNNTTYDIKAKSVVDTNSGKLFFWSGTKNQFDAIATKDANTLYEIEGYGVFLGTTQIAAGSAELNNPFSLFDFQFADHILNNASWLRADTFSWQSGAVYVSAYEHLVADIAGITAETETIGGYTVTFYRATDGHKICLADQETIVNNIFTATGAAWYYILDTENERFKLPRGLHGTVVRSYKNGTDWYRVYSDGWCEQGGIIDVNYAQQISTVTFLKPYADTNYNVLLSMGGFAANGVGNCSWQNKTTTTFEIYGDYTNSTALNVPTTWQTSGYISDDFNDMEKYLYFYVGETVQDANLINAGVIPEYVSSLRTVHAVIDTYQNGTSWYRVYDDGWCEQGGILTVSGTSQVINFLKPYINTNYIITYANGYDSAPSGTHLVCFGNKTTNSITRFGSASWTLTYWRTEGYIS